MRLQKYRVHRFAALSQLSHAVKNQEKPLGPE